MDNTDKIPEQLDIVNEHGDKTGESQTYEETHRQGLAHRTVHVWFFNPSRELLIQKRSKNKQARPGYWDISAAGHISSGETSLEAAQKETKEELEANLPGSMFIFLFTVRAPIVKYREDFIDNEFCDVYLVHSTAKTSDLHLQTDEVDEVKWVSIPQLKNLIQGNGEKIVPHDEEYQKLFEYLENL